MDQCYKSMKDDTELERRGNDDENVGEEGQMKSFYNGRTIFLTGSTGFIGQCVVEKLLRTCTGVNRIYALVRSKKKRSIEERVNSYFDNALFGKLRQENPDFAKKFVPIEGDMMKDGLGISPEDRRMIAQDTDIVINNGAIVGFQVNLSTMLKVNVMGTKSVPDLVRECPRIRCLIYVSTAFSNCGTLQLIEEKLYEPPTDLAGAALLIKLLDAGLEERAIQPDRMKWVNHYAFSKAIANGVVAEFKKTASFPCVIYKPSIVISTYADPVPGWNCNMNGTNLPTIAYALGLLHTQPMDLEARFDTVAGRHGDERFAGLRLVYRDFQRNRSRRRMSVRLFRNEETECAVIQYASSKVNPLYNSHSEKVVRQYIFDMPTNKAYWMPSLLLTTNIYLFFAIHYVVHLIPCVIADAFIYVTQGRKPRLASLLWKLNLYIRTTSLFVLTDWNIEMKAVYDMLDRMNAKGHREFFCDLRRMDWEIFLSGYWPGLRVYLLNESPETIPAARRKQRIFRAISYSVIAFVFSLLLYLLCAWISYGPSN